MPSKYDYSPYIGTPWESGGRNKDDALDCWGLVWSIYNEVYGLYLPSLSDIHIANGFTETAEAISSVYPSIHKNFYEPDDTQEGDIIMLNMAGQPIHIGVCLDHQRMIHTTQKVGCVVEKFKQRVWLNRVEGIYRHKDFK